MTHQLLTTQPEIESWLDLHGIKNYTLTPHSQYGFTVSVPKDVNISNQRIEFLAVQFSHINGSFICNYNKLASLQGCPNSVGGDFLCNNNLLTSLQFCTQKIGGFFSCCNNHLTSLEFSPQSVGTAYECGANELTSLQGAPEIINGYFSCNENYLTSLEYCPRITKGGFYCDFNQLKSVEHCPQSVGGEFYCSNNPLLGEIQDMKNFKQVYGIHQELVKIKEEKMLLESSVNDRLVREKHRYHKI